MKQLAILILGCLPLAVLAFASFFEPPAIAPAREESVPADSELDAARKLADEISKRQSHDRPMIEQLNELEPLGDKTIIIPENTAVAQSLHEAAGAIGDSRKAAEMVAKLRGVPLVSPSWSVNGASKDPLGKVSEIRSELDRFIQDNRNDGFGKMPGAEKVFVILEDTRDRMDKEIDALTLLQQGRKQFSEENKYDEAISTLKKIDPQTIDDLGKRNKLAEVIARYLSRAEYWRDIPPPPRTLESLAKFFERYPEHRDRMDEKKHQGLRDELSKLQSEDSRKNRVKELQSVAVGLGNAGTLDELELAIASFRKEVGESKILSPADKSELAAAARASVVEWHLRIAFPRKEPPALLAAKGNQEAYANNKRYLGAFTLDINFYRFWEWDSPQNRLAHPQGDEKIEKIQITHLEKAPMYVQWADFYNETSESLARGGSDAKNARPLRSQWGDFFDQCKKTQEAFERYQQQWGTVREPDLSCKDWTFLPDRRVLGNQDIEAICIRLEKLHRVLEP
jgi:tetratricopeptide (TPR) repeat protein